MRRTQRQHSGVVAGWVAFVMFAPCATGCVASIKENRLYGASRPRFDGAPDVIHERKPDEDVLRATVDGSTLDVSVVRASECRDIHVTSRVQDVAVRRSFADDAQERNGALALLFGAGAGLLQYSADQVNCPSGSACWSTMISAEYGLLALAAIPVGFVIYNALRVRDGRAVEPAPPEVRQSAWRTCGAEPLADESVAISIGSLELVRETDATGHAWVDLGALARDAGEPEERKARVRHSGSRDLVVDLARTAPKAAP
jgi:hypothetical protein